MTTERSPFVDKLFGFIQVWGVPIGMTIAYLILMWSAETDNTGKAWMAIGLGFVYVIWYVFRLLTTQAALSRALDNGDSAQIISVADRQLKKLRDPAARAPYLVARAFAHELRGEWTGVLADLDAAKLDAMSPKARFLWQLRASSSRVAALVALDRTAEARTVLERDLKPDANHVVHSDSYLVAHLAAGRVLAAEGKSAEAISHLVKVRDDVRASAAMRASASVVN